MKIRNGFVSNSSSSSFIVCWNKQPKDAEEVKKILFGDKKKHSYYDNTFKTIDLSKTIFNETHQMTDEELYDMQSEKYYYSGSKWVDVGYKADKDLLNKYEKEMKEAISEKERLIKYLKDEKIQETIKRKVKLSRVDNSDYEISQEEQEILNIKQIIRELDDKIYSEPSELINDSVRKFKEDNKDVFWSHYEFSDNDGSEQCCLEHGEVFSNLKHEQISHH